MICGLGIVTGHPPRHCEADEITERPDLTGVGVAAEHQVNAGIGGLRDL